MDFIKADLEVDTVHVLLDGLLRELEIYLGKRNDFETFCKAQEAPESV